ncbi:NACHT domain-containing protein [Streptomyces sp. F001]|uniref:NACHT domain-containing protein n=1 Tax=Streptomyces sp. F001 TaxID=1510026 RepID=UPI00101E30A3|nr:NACHT domain-containing protein [Streptomyces sp. F001]
MLRRLGLGVAGAASIALVVALVRHNDDKDAAALWVSVVSAALAVCAFTADLLRGQSGAETAAAGNRRLQAADDLAEAVRVQWAAEARLRRLQDPAPLDVHWSRVGPPLADHPRNIACGLPLPAPRDGDERLDRIVGTFRAVPSGRLVVLGDPGAGKTILAVRFVLGSLAVRRPGDPVPVLFPLASWDPRSAPLRGWLAERLATEYRPLAAVRDGRTLARELLDEGLVLPVLDGLDELPEATRELALRRLNAELDERLPVLLTCRTAQWASAVRGGDVLTAAEVVRLRPLDFDTARNYLERTARSSCDGSTAWTPVLAAPTPPLTDVLTTPLMVALARTVYGDTSRSPAELADPGRFPTAQAIEEHLLDAFVPAAFADAEGTWRPGAAHHWLSRLARDLGRRRPGSTPTWRLAWWELPTVMPRALGVIGPTLLALLATAALLVPLAVSGGGVVANWDSGLSAVLNFAGIGSGLCFGLAFLLPATAETPQGPRWLARTAARTTAAATVVAVGLGLLVPPLVGARLGAVITPRPTWFLNGCCFGLILAMMFAVAGLPRRPLPLALPWAGSPSGPVAVRVAGALVVFAGLAIQGYYGALVPAATCCGAGLLLSLAGLRRGERAAAQHPGPAAVLRGFRRGLLRGFVACTLIGVTASAVVGCVSGAFAAYRIHWPAHRLQGGEVFEGWRLHETDDGERSVRSTGPREVLLVERAALDRPFTVMKGARISWDERLGRRTEEVRIRAGSDGWVVDWTGLPDEWDGRAVDAHNLVVALPDPVKVWLVHRPVGTVVRDAVVPLVWFGVLIGAIGGCASGVYRALNTPSDTIRAAGPQSTLRTDRAATLARSAIAALLAGGVCLVLISALRRGSTLGTMHTELWVPVGTSALALGAWGRMGAARIWLAVTGRAPWRLMQFLEEAHRRGVLRQSGAHYEFRHLRLQNRLAEVAGAGCERRAEIQRVALWATAAATAWLMAYLAGRPVLEAPAGDRLDPSETAQVITAVGALGTALGMSAAAIIKAVALLIHARADMERARTGRPQVQVQPEPEPVSGDEQA